MLCDAVERDGHIHEKSIALLLTVAMMVSIIAIPALSAEIESRYFLVKNVALQLKKETVLMSADSNGVIASCPNWDSVHIHIVDIYNRYINCPMCGYYFDGTYTKEYCP